MAYKRPISTPIYRKATGSRAQQKRIRIPQPSLRPMLIHSKDLVKTDKDPWWFVLHRKGLRRLKVGEDPLEARAVSKDMVRGTLPERIVYKYLEDILKFIPNVDFDFQSSQSGGRVELGGLVADFLFYYMRIVIQVQGSTHTEYLRKKKDEEQRGILEEMGYRVFDIEELVCYDIAQLEEWMRRTFGLALGFGGGFSTSRAGGMMGGASVYSDGEQNLATFEEEYEDSDKLQQVLNSVKDITGRF